MIIGTTIKNNRYELYKLAQNASLEQIFRNIFPDQALIKLAFTFQIHFIAIHFYFISFSSSFFISSTISSSSGDFGYHDYNFWLDVVLNFYFLFSKLPASLELSFGLLLSSFILQSIHWFWFARKIVDVVRYFLQKVKIVWNDLLFRNIHLNVVIFH